MRVLITGAGGFIGRHLSAQLQKYPDWQVTGLGGRAQVDLADSACLETLPPAEAIVHLAGVVGLEAFDRDPLGSWQSNLLSTLNILEHARRTGAQQLILTSSYVYGPPQYLPVDEVHPIAPHHAYQRSKYLSEQMAEQFAIDGGPAVTVLRLFNVYGPGQDAGMLIPTLLAQLKQPGIQLRDPNPRRDYVHVRDVATAIVSALTHPGNQKMRLYNIGSGKSLSVAELVETLLAEFGEHRPVTWLGLRRGHEVDEVVADISKAGAELGWQPRISLSEGLRELV